MPMSPQEQRHIECCLSSTLFQANAKNEVVARARIHVVYNTLCLRISCLSLQLRLQRRRLAQPRLPGMHAEPHA